MYIYIYDKHIHIIYIYIYTYGYQHMPGLELRRGFFTPDILTSGAEVLGLAIVAVIAISSY